MQQSCCLLGQFILLQVYQLHLPYIFVQLTPNYNGASIVLFVFGLSLFVISTCHLPLTQFPPSPIKIVEICVVNGMLVHV